MNFHLYSNLGHTRKLYICSYSNIIKMWCDVCYFIAVISDFQTSNIVLTDYIFIAYHSLLVIYITALNPLLTLLSTPHPTATGA